ncbi:MAG: excinuclease ABC subunit UvrC [Gammaproteobacteria bacterium]|tara:strand:- start:11721 stop:13538 length:1818 start_codon:yes stop_codon:yes gene_type:complete
MEKQVHFKNKKILFNKNIDFPESPGVYKFFNSENEIIYIGKAKNIKNRVKSYFNIREAEGKRISKLKLSIKYIETIITKTESDALILEQGLISKIRPPFNVQFRDDKSYPAIHISTSKEFPAIYVSRQKDPKATIFGPFANVAAMRLNVSLIRSLFKIRNCKDINFKNRSRPCIEYQMNRCSAPCVGNISRQEYSTDVDSAIKFLSGDTKKIILDLTKKMDFYSEKKDYERAAVYRDKVQSIRDTQKKQNVLTGFDDLDIFVIKRNKFSCCLSVLRIEDGWITSSQNFYPDTKDNITDSELLSIFIESYVIKNKHRKIMNLLFQGDISKETKDFLDKLKSPQIFIKKPNKHNKNLIDICSSQADDALSRNRNYSWIQSSFESLENFLKIETINRVEGFDVSHTSGKNVSASCVNVTKDGPVKKNYRIMNIKKDFNDDYLSLSEAIQRRCLNLQKNNLSLPKVILLDGGKGQLNTVKKNLDVKLLQDIRLISVSKGPNRNEKYDILHDGNNTYELRNSDEISKLLQLIRNESHRFAISHHRKRRSKELFSSSIDGIDGVGPKLKIKLIRFFGGLDKISQASLEDLKSAPGIGERKAEKIYYHLKGI